MADPAAAPQAPASERPTIERLYDMVLQNERHLSALMASVSSLTESLSRPPPPPARSATSTASPPPPQPLASISQVAFRQPEVPTFHGEPSKLGTWLIAVENCMRMMKVSDESTAIAYASLFLRDSALAMWHNMVQQFGFNAGCKDFAEFSRLLKENLGVVEPEITLRAKLASLKQTKSVEAYYKIYNDTLLQLPRPRDDTETREEFIRGLKPDVQLHVRRCAAKTYLEAVVAARSYEGTVKTAGQVPHQHASTSSRSSATPMDIDALVSSLTSWAANRNRSGSGTSTPSASQRGRTPNRRSTPAHSRSPSRGSRSSSPARRVPLASLSESEKRELREKGLCFYCRKPGHTVSDCPKRPKKPHVAFRKN